jgi:hypothetical protein
MLGAASPTNRQRKQAGDNMPDIGWQVGIDIGGTFTDLVALRPTTGELRSIKVPTSTSTTWCTARRW